MFVCVVCIMCVVCMLHICGCVVSVMCMWYMCCVSAVCGICHISMFPFVVRYGGIKLILKCHLQSVPYLIFRGRVLHWVWNSPIPVGLLDSKHPGSTCLHFFMLRFHLQTTTLEQLCLRVSVVYLNSGPHNSTASAETLEPPSQPGYCEI